MKFKMSMRAEPSCEMMKLVDHYKTGPEHLAAGDLAEVTIGRLLDGLTFEGIVLELNKKDAAVLAGCELFTHYLDVSTEVIDLDTQSQGATAPQPRQVHAL